MKSLLSFHPQLSFFESFTLDTHPDTHNLTLDSQPPFRDSSPTLSHPFVMSALVEAFKIKPFELEPIYSTWPSAPIFAGNPKRDMPVDDWLKEIKEGCLARKVPKEYWHKVGQHYLGPNAKARFDELKAVMKNMHGGRYNWNWKRFKVAMRNMGCKFRFGLSRYIHYLTKRLAQGRSIPQRLRKLRCRASPPACGGSLASEMIRRRIATALASTVLLVSRRTCLLLPDSLRSPHRRELCHGTSLR